MIHNASVGKVYRVPVSIVGIGENCRANYLGKYQEEPTFALLDEPTGAIYRVIPSGKFSINYSTVVCPDGFKIEEYSSLKSHSDFRDFLSWVIGVCSKRLKGFHI